jgi:hypothetical protein
MTLSLTAHSSIATYNLLYVTVEPSVVMLSVVMLNVVAPFSMGYILT